MSFLLSALFDSQSNEHCSFHFMSSCLSSDICSNVPLSNVPKVSGKYFTTSSRPFLPRMQPRLAKGAYSLPAGLALAQHLAYWGIHPSRAYPHEKGLYEGSNYSAGKTQNGVDLTPEQRQSYMNQLRDYQIAARNRQSRGESSVENSAAFHSPHMSIQHLPITALCVFASRPTFPQLCKIPRDKPALVMEHLKKGACHIGIELYKSIQGQSLLQGLALRWRQQGRGSFLLAPYAPWAWSQVA